jgi:hypothetical protein
MDEGLVPGVPDQIGGRKSQQVLRGGVDGDHAPCGVIRHENRGTRRGKEFVGWKLSGKSCCPVTDGVQIVFHQ